MRTSTFLRRSSFSLIVLLLSASVCPYGMISAASADAPETTASVLQDIQFQKLDTPKIPPFLLDLQAAALESELSAESFAADHSLTIENGRIQLFLIATKGKLAGVIDTHSLSSFGAEIIKTAGDTMVVSVPVTAISQLESVSGLSYVRLPDAPQSFAITQQGVSLTRAATYHAAGNSGSGVKIAIIDLGFASLAAAQAAGEAPSNATTIDCTGVSCTASAFPSEDENHGTAVTQVVYDLAPQATYYLLKVSTAVDLRSAKDYAIAHGVQVVNFSVGFANQNFYDGACYAEQPNSPVCTVNDAAAHGILWVNAAGNQAQRHYEGTFTDTNSDGFDDTAVTLTAVQGDLIQVFLTWNLWPLTNQDFDFYLFDSHGAFVWGSAGNQTGTQEPAESFAIYAPATDTYTLKMHKYSATTAPAYSIVSFNHSLSPAVAAHSLLSPADAVSALTVGAVAASVYTTGPLESYSSRGPNAAGAQKPDLVAPDAISTSFGSFAGTSAASPQVVGAAAVYLSKYPLTSLANLKKTLTGSAIDMGTAGVDSLYGYGRLSLPVTVPLVTTSGAVLGNTITLRGTVNPTGFPTTYYFRYGSGAGLPTATQSATQSAGTSSGAAVVTQTVSVQSGTPFFGQLIATSAGGTATGSIVSFNWTDIYPPVISSLTGSSLTTTGATITWTTDEAASGKVQYGTGSLTGSSALVPALSTSHSIRLTHLSGQTQYSFRVLSKDAGNNTGTSSTLTFTTATPDTRAPMISSVSAGSLSTSSAVITWTTDELATSQIEYGLTGSYGLLTTLNTTHGLSHSETLSGLQADTTYSFRVLSADASGNTRTSTGYTLHTSAAAAVQSGSSGGGGGGGGSTSPSIGSTPILSTKPGTVTPLSISGSVKTTASGAVPSSSGSVQLPALRGLLNEKIEGKAVLFRDIQIQSWFASFVHMLIQRGIVSGYRDAAGNFTGYFGPENPVTYAEIAKMAILGMSINPRPATGGLWSAPYLQAAREQKLSVYLSLENPDAPATRGAVLQVIMEAFHLPAAKTTVTYSDVPTSHRYSAAIAAASSLGIVSGDTDASGKATGTFRPDAPINRAEVSKIFSKLIEKGYMK